MSTRDSLQYKATLSLTPLRWLTMCGCCCCWSTGPPPLLAPTICCMPLWLFLFMRKLLR